MKYHCKQNKNKFLFILNVRKIFMSHLINTTIIYFIRYSTFQSFCVSSYNADLHNFEFQTTIFLFTRNAASHNTDLILTDFLYAYTSSLMNVLEVELENSRSFIMIYVFYLHSLLLRSHLLVNPPLSYS